MRLTKQNMVRKYWFFKFQWRTNYNITIINVPASLVETTVPTNVVGTTRIKFYVTTIVVWNQLFLQWLLEQPPKKCLFLQSLLEQLFPKWLLKQLFQQSLWEQKFSFGGCFYNLSWNIKNSSVFRENVIHLRWLKLHEKTILSNKN